MLAKAPKNLRRSSSRSLARLSRSLSAVLLALAVVIGCPARAAEPVIPAPPSRWVTDVPGMLSTGVRDALDAKLRAYEDRTGHQVVVWIGTTAEGVPIEDFAEKAFRTWAIGRKGHDDGLLVVIFARDRKIDIEVGYGLEDRVPDAKARRVIDDVMVPLLRKGDSDGAVSSGVDAILSTIEGKALPGAGPDSSPAPAPPSKFQIVLLAILGIGFLLLLVTHPALALNLLFVLSRGGGSFGGGGSDRGFRGGGGRSGGGGARGSW